MRSPDYTRLASQLPALYQDDPASYVQIDAFLGLADELSRAHLERLEDIALQVSPDAMLRWPPEVALDAGSDALLASYLETYDVVASWFGFVFPAGDVEALQRLLQWCLDEREALARMREAARASAADWQWSDYREAIRRACA